MLKVKHRGQFQAQDLFHVTFHTHFVPADTHMLRFTKQELDLVGNGDRIPDELMLDLIFQRSQSPPSLSLSQPSRDPVGRTGKTLAAVKAAGRALSGREDSESEVEEEEEHGEGKEGEGKLEGNGSDVLDEDGEPVSPPPSPGKLRPRSASTALNPNPSTSPSPVPAEDFWKAYVEKRNAQLSVEDDPPLLSYVRPGTPSEASPHPRGQEARGGKEGGGRWGGQ